MPATAGRVRMPANNRVHSSAALQTHGIWQSAIGYDPYAPNKDDPKISSQHQSSAIEPDAENTYLSFQGLLALARITGSNADEARGACKKCGRIGHLSFQCRNFLSVKDDSKERNSEMVLQDAMLSGLDRSKRNAVGDTESEEGEEESEISDSDEDSEMERIIAERRGKNCVRKARLPRRDSSSDEVDDDDSESSDSNAGDRRRMKRGRSKKRRSRKRESQTRDLVDDEDDDDDDEAARRRRREKRRKRDESGKDDRCCHRRKSMREKRRRRSRKYSDASDSDTSRDCRKRHKRKNKKRRPASDSDSGGTSSSDDPRTGRDKKRTVGRIRRRFHDQQ